MKIDITKPVRTRDGRSVRILCTDKKGNYPIVGLVTNEDGSETVCSYRLDGVYYSAGESGCDLVNVPVRVERWLNIYHPSLSHSVYPEYCTTRDIADSQAGPNRIGILHIVYEDDKVISTSYTAV
jgi:hypothetical protein